LALRVTFRIHHEHGDLACSLALLAMGEKRDGRSAGKRQYDLTPSHLNFPI
jgi:hypothetical protein